ncbi:uncharacterized protein LOC104896150 [Beta vulgaris subsp. vulgaris]|uniref:uncharacterized protein LOC104896150 n=1 Tax=Beta vulgaris subsp. vulgaris TaxID=3555 RepID=UPI0020375B85|nr:uncharacterized protein LOC104896150 [Beta vulgaris subsp. vulgaris]
MVNFWSPCLLSLLFICFFIASTATVSTHYSILYSPLISHYDGYASKEDIMASNAKGTPIQACASIEKRKKLKGETPNRSSLKDNAAVAKCDYVKNKVSSKSMLSSVNEVSSSSNERCQRRMARRLLPRQRYMDPFIAHADYRGPQRHPPKNN